MPTVLFSDGEHFGHDIQIVIRIFCTLANLFNLMKCEI